ncbi:GNAT family N-acetyltransferase [Mycetocola saprophilus]|uniref:GNAT family N-acetyltransferase n=1 Tax=Mycetocola saprophilus TaxID=76636 RepID=UPI003BF39820
MNTLYDLTDVAGNDVRHLLWLAAEVEDTELDRMTRDELPHLRVRGLSDEDGLIAFIAADHRSNPAEIMYIAVHERARGRGLGRVLVRDLADAVAGREIVAQTDDDAVEFYRRLGFTITDGEIDPRWPDRHRYVCRLSPRA